MTRDDKFEYFIEETGKKFDKIDETFDKVLVKLDDLLSFKFKFIGASVVLSILINVVFIYIEKHN